MLLASLACTSDGAFAQADAPLFYRYGLEDGISHRAVLSLAEDDQGFLWVGTQGGLNRFDGHEFATFTGRPGDSTSLPGSFVRSLLVGSQGALWIGTERGLYRRDRGGTFTSFRVAARAAPNNVLSIAEHASGRLLLSTAGGVFGFDPETGTSRAVPGGPVGEEGQAVGSLVAASLPDGSILVGYDDGLLRRLTLDEADGWIELDRLRLESLPTALHAVSDRAVLVGTRSGRVVEVDPSARLRVTDALVEDGEAAPVQDIHRDWAGTTWVATQDGLLEIDPSGRSRRHMTDPLDPTSLPDPNVSVVTGDRAGVLWVGTWQGVAAVGSQRYAIRRYPGRDQGRGTLSTGGVVAIDRAPDGTVWLGLRHGALDGFDPRRGVTRRYRPDGSDPGQMGAGIYGVEIDRSGRVWSATLGAGLIRLSPRTGELRTYSALTRNDSATVNFVDIYEDHRGELWAGSPQRVNSPDARWSRSGLYRFDADAGRFVEFRGPDGSWDFGEPYIWSLTEDSLGQLWFASDGPRGGIHRLSADRTGLWSLMFDPDEAGGLSEGRILTLYPHIDGSVWVGTEGGGLNRVDPRDGSVKVYTTADGLPHDHVNGIVADDTGHLWITTLRGLARFDPERETFWTFRARDGLHGDEFYANSVFRSPDGALYFGGPGGLTVVDPSAIVEPSEPPTVAFTRFRIHAEDRRLGPWAWGEGEGLVIEPGDNFFSFEFAALGFGEPSLDRYRYKLEGLDEEWIENGSDRIAPYTSVPPGSYTFLVSAAKSDGRWNEEAIRIPVTVRPRFYQTVWFRALAVALVAALVTAAYTYRVRQQLRLERVRVRIAGELHDDIGANLSTISLRARMAEATGEVGEGARRQLRQVSELARDTAVSLRELVWVVNTDYDTLEHLVTRMEDEASTMLEGVVEYSFEVDGSLPDVDLSMELRRSVYLMFKEVLQNVERHAAAERVDIRLACRGRDLILSVTDDGVGFDPGSVQPGNGYRLMEQRTRRHKATVDVDSHPGDGTTIRFTVPMG